MCNLVHFGKKLTVLQFSTFVNENIVIVLDSGIDIVVLLQRGGSKFVSGEGELHPWLDKPLLTLALVKCTDTGTHSKLLY